MIKEIRRCRYESKARELLEKWSQDEYVGFEDRVDFLLRKDHYFTRLSKVEKDSNKRDRLSFIAECAHQERIRMYMNKYSSYAIRS